MFYILIDEQRKTNCIEYIKSLPCDKYEVEIKEYKKNRTKSQNRLMWMWLPILGDHFGYDKEEMHDEFKYAFLGEETYINRKGIERVRPKSTTKLTTKEMAEYLTKIEILAGREGIHLPKPDDYLYIMGKE